MTAAAQPYLPEHKDRPSDGTGFILGRHAALIESLAEGQEKIARSMESMSGDVRTIRESLAETKGERRVIIAGAGLVGGAMGLIISLIHKFIGVP